MPTINIRYEFIVRQNMIYAHLSNLGVLDDDFLQQYWDLKEVAVQLVGILDLFRLAMMEVRRPQSIDLYAQMEPLRIVASELLSTCKCTKRTKILVDLLQRQLDMLADVHKFLQVTSVGSLEYNCKLTTTVASDVKLTSLKLRELFRISGK